MENNKKIEKEKYLELKNLASKCVEDFTNSKYTLWTIDSYINLYRMKNKLNSKDEFSIFKSMVLFPNSRNFIFEFKHKNIKEFINKYNLKDSDIHAKLFCIEYYEKEYEKNQYLNISNADILKLNKDITDFINSSLKLANSSLNYNYKRKGIK